jgi:hypothetical protein
VKNGGIARRIERLALALFTIAVALSFPVHAHADDAIAPPTSPTSPTSIAPPPTSSTEPAAQADETRHFTPDPRMQKLLERRTTIDLNLEAGLGHVFGDPGKTNAFGRARARVLLVRAPFYEALGLTYEYSGLSPLTFGVQGELAWSGGFWGQIGALLDVSHTHARWGGMAALGFAIVGVEGQLRDAASTGSAWALYGKIRLPLTLLGLGTSAASVPSAPAPAPAPAPSPASE